MAEKENELIKEAKETYEVLTGDDEVKRLAEIRLMSYLEEQAALECAREKGLEKGYSLKRLLKLNLPIEQIIEITQLDKDEILKLKN